MKILMVAPRAYPMLGGVEKHIHELSKALIEQGDEVDVITHRPKGSNIKLSQVIDGVKYMHYDLPWKENYYTISSELVSYVILKQKDYDVIHLQAMHKPLAMYLMWRLRNTKAKIVFTPHYHGGGHTGFANFAHIFYRKLSKMIIGRVDSIIAVSDSEAELIKRDFPNVASKIEVIPNGIVEPAKAKPFKKERPVLLTVSRLEPYKRIDTVIEMMPDTIDFVIVGGGDDRARLEALAKKLNKNVTFTGNIDDETLNRWWATADGFVSLSEMEAYGLTFGEALSLGIPCLVSDIPAYRYVAKLSHNSKNISFFERNTNFLSRLKPLTADNKRGAKTLIFTWSLAASKTRNLYSRDKE